MSYPEPRYLGDGGETSARLVPATTLPVSLNMPRQNTTYLATGADTGGHFGLYRWDFGTARSGPDPHFHRTLTESFYILSGVVSLHNGEGWTDHGAGDFLFVPEGGIHGFKNYSGEPASMLILFTPGAPREEYFETLVDIAQGTRARMTPEERAEFMLRHDTYWLD
jgi:mannose-6-phosphate isomerase-like protein (cupin superfamily)